MSHPPWLARLLRDHPDLAPTVAHFREVAAVLRAATRQAFVAPAEPPHPQQAELQEKLLALAERAQKLSEQPDARAAWELLAELFVLRAESYFLAPTRATSGPIARWVLAESLQQFRQAWAELERACQAAGVPVPLRLLLASHVDETLPMEQLELVGNELPGVPLASLPWGERCALTGIWFQKDGDGRPRFRSDQSFFSLAPQAYEFFSRCQKAFSQLQRGTPEALEAALAAFPELGHAFYEARSGPTFAGLGLTEFPSQAVSLNNALLRFSNRTLFVKAWEKESHLSYGDVRQKALGLAHALEAAGIAAGDKVAVAFKNPGWESYLVDFACVFAHLSTVGLDPAASPEHWESVVAQAGAAAVVGDREGLERLTGFSGHKLCLDSPCPPGSVPLEPTPPPPGWRSRSGVGLETPVLFDDEPSWQKAKELGIAADSQEDLYTVVFTSGSTGIPKPIPITRQRMRAGMEYQAFLYPLITASFQPFALLADRMSVWQTLLNGGTVGFCRRGLELWQDLQALGPTYLEGPPALFQPLVQAYQQALERQEPVSELARLRLALRARLGGRVAAAAVGGAAVPEGFAKLLETILGVPVHEAYGATEVGTIAYNGKLQANVAVRLVDRPDLGFTQADRPYPRGELAVKLPRYALPGYDPSRITQDGYFLTGDLVELRPDGTVKVLGRTSAAVKLADGYFVLAEEMEQALLATGFCQQAAVVPSPTGPVAVVVAGPEAPRENLEARLAGALAQRFPGRALPAIVVDPENTPWTPENRLLTPSLKPNRSAIAAYYRHLLVTPKATTALPEAEPSTTGSLLNLVARILHRPEQALDLTLPLAQQGLDSLACAEILSLADARAVPLGVEEVRFLPLGELLVKLQQPPGIRSMPASPPQGVAKAPVTASREDEVALQVLRTPLPQTIPEFSPRGLTVLTGATGFLGIHLLAELAAGPAAGGSVVALVRAQDHEHARHRLKEAAVRAAIPIPEPSLPGDPEKSLWAVAADLSHPQLGLPHELYTPLARETAVIVHAAAAVLHGASFAELVEDNVTPTRNLLDFAVTQRLKAFHLVSSLDVTRLASSLGAGGSEEAPLPPRLGEAAARADGYVLTKWVSERMVELLAQHCQGRMPVLVSRPGLLSWATTSGYAPTKEWFPALLASCLQVGALPLKPPAVFPSEPVLSETSARGLELLPVDFAAELLARLSVALMGAAEKGDARFFRLNLVNTNPGTAGLALWPQIFCYLQAAYLAEFPHKKPLKAVSLADFLDLCLAANAPFAPLVPSFRELPAVPRTQAETMKAFCGDESPPPISWHLFCPFVRQVAGSAR